MGGVGGVGGHIPCAPVLASYISGNLATNKPWYTFLSLASMFINVCVEVAELGKTQVACFISKLPAILPLKALVAVSKSHK